VRSTTQRPLLQFAHDHTRAAADFDHLLAGPDRQFIEQTAHDADISGAAALLEARDTAEMSAPKGDRGPACGECRGKWLPLPGQQFERQQLEWQSRPRML
jgi:hypothetical protein